MKWTRSKNGGAYVRTNERLVSIFPWEDGWRVIIKENGHTRYLPRSQSFPHYPTFSSVDQAKLAVGETSLIAENSGATMEVTTRKGSDMSNLLSVLLSQVPVEELDRPFHLRKDGPAIVAKMVGWKPSGECLIQHARDGAYGVRLQTFSVGSYRMTTRRWLCEHWVAITEVRDSTLADPRPTVAEPEPAPRQPIETIMSFLREDCIIGRGMEMPKNYLYESYLEHCQDAGKDPVGPRIFGKELIAVVPSVQARERGKSGEDRVFVYRGIGMRRHRKT